MMAEFDKACTSPSSLAQSYMAHVHGHGYGPRGKECIHAERTGMCDDNVAEVYTILRYLVVAGHYMMCILTVTAPRID